jgi:hypothetical protein
VSVFVPALVPVFVSVFVSFLVSVFVSVLVSVVVSVLVSVLVSVFVLCGRRLWISFNWLHIFVNVYVSVPFPYQFSSIVHVRTRSTNILQSVVLARTGWTYTWGRHLVNIKGFDVFLLKMCPPAEFAKLCFWGPEFAF